MGEIELAGGKAPTGRNERERVSQRHGVTCEAVPQETRPSGDGEAKDRGLPSGNLRDDNDATRQKNQQESPVNDERWYKEVKYD